MRNNLRENLVVRDDNMVTCIRKETWKIDVTSVQCTLTSVSAGNLYTVGRNTIYYLDVYVDECSKSFAWRYLSCEWMYYETA